MNNSMICTSGKASVKKHNNPQTQKTKFNKQNLIIINLLLLNNIFSMTTVIIYYSVAGELKIKTVSFYAHLLSHGFSIERKTKEENTDKLL